MPSSPSPTSNWVLSLANESHYISLHLITAKERHESDYELLVNKTSWKFGPNK